MDEAENCQRIAMIFGGRILACDGPAGLKKKFAGDLDRPTLQEVFIRLMRQSEDNRRRAVV
jgi:ABC-2 type transport system ATP-binding protein